MRTLEHQVATRVVDRVWDDLTSGEGEGDDRPMDETERQALVAQVSTWRMDQLFDLYVRLLAAGAPPASPASPANKEEASVAGDDRPAVRRR